MILKDGRGKVCFIVFKKIGAGIVLTYLDAINKR